MSKKDEPKEAANALAAIALDALYFLDATGLPVAAITHGAHLLRKRSAERSAAMRKAEAVAEARRVVEARMQRRRRMAGVTVVALGAVAAGAAAFEAKGDPRFPGGRST